MSKPDNHHTLTLDVRSILARNEEPYPVIREKVDGLRPGVSLKVVAPFLPAPLIERLKGEGFSAEVEHRGDGAWVVVFTRPATPGSTNS